MTFEANFRLREWHPHPRFGYKPARVTALLHWSRVSERLSHDEWGSSVLAVAARGRSKRSVGAPPPTPPPRTSPPASPGPGAAARNLGPIELLVSADDRDDLGEAAALGERFPPAPLRVGPRAERRRGVMAGIGVDEQRAVGIDRYRQREREVPPSAAYSTAIEPRGAEATLDAGPGVSNAPTFSGAVGSHGRSGCLSTYSSGRRRSATPADAPDVREGVFGGHGGADQGVDDTSDLFGMPIQKLGPLSPSRDAVGDQSDGRR